MMDTYKKIFGKEFVKVKYDKNAVALDVIAKSITGKGYKVIGEVKDQPEEVSVEKAQE